VDGIESMYDRSKCTPVSDYIISTYHSGLPLFNGNQPLQKHTIHAMKIIFHKVPTLASSVRKPMFLRLAESYTACQMEQGRVIDSIFGAITGRDKTLIEQILNIVDTQKEQILKQIVNRYNPDAWKTDDDNPKGQITHIQSSYTIALGTTLGLRGVKAAEMDKNSFALDKTNTKYLLMCFRRMFLVQDLINTIYTDVNQQNDDADRLVDCNSLTKWAGDQKYGFEAHSIFYDEDRPLDWPKDLGVPKDKNKYQPFLNNNVTLDILVHLFLKE